MKKSVKCMVWDLDNTLWQGTLAEGDQLILNQEIISLIRDLDTKGVLHSIASRNDFEAAWAQLKTFGIEDLFLYPQIHWQTKSGSVRAIADALNLGLDSFYFIDDQAFEVEEVKTAHPQVRCCLVDELQHTLDSDQACFPKQVSPESQQRRSLYATELRRLSEQAHYSGDNQAFLKSLNLELSIEPLKEQEIVRAQELTERTNQLNTTGYTYSVAQLKKLIASPNHWVMQSTLKDRFGDYGIVGLCIAEQSQQALIIRLFLLSCRVMNRSIAGPILQFLKNQADAQELKLQAEFKSNDRNRQMLITYRFAGFKTVAEDPDSGIKLLTHQRDQIQLNQEHIEVISPIQQEVFYG